MFCIPDYTVWWRSSETLTQRKQLHSAYIINKCDWHLCRKWSDIHKNFLQNKEGNKQVFLPNDMLYLGGTIATTISEAVLLVSCNPPISGFRMSGVQNTQTEILEKNFGHWKKSIFDCSGTTLANSYGRTANWTNTGHLNPQQINDVQCLWLQKPYSVKSA